MNNFKKLCFPVTLVVIAWLLGYFANAGVAWIEARGDHEPDPKSAPEVDRKLLNNLLLAEYQSVEQAIDYTFCPRVDYLDRIRMILLNSLSRSEWLRMRLIDEIGRSARLEDAGFLLKMAPVMPEKWLQQHARQQAERVAARASDGSQ